MKVTMPAAWRLYWSGPLPLDASPLGTIEDNGMTGALLYFTRTKIYRRGNENVLSSVDQKLCKRLVMALERNARRTE